MIVITTNAAPRDAEYVGNQHYDNAGKDMLRYYFDMRQFPGVFLALRWKTVFTAVMIVIFVPIIRLAFR